MAMGVPKRLVDDAISLTPYPLPDEAQTWLDTIAYVLQPEPSLREKKPRWAGRGLALYGPSGSGKTTMAVQLLLRLVRKEMLDPWFGMNRPTERALGMFRDWQDISQAMREEAAGESSLWWTYTESALRNGCGFTSVNRETFGGTWTVLDDISRERKTEYNLDRLGHYLRKRYDNEIPTIVTTNLYPEEWERAYGDVLGPFMHRAFIAAEVS